MTLEELIRRTRADLNARIARHNAITEELATLRAAEPPDQERIAALLTERQNLAAERTQLASQLTDYEAEQREDAAVARLQAEVTPTPGSVPSRARAEVRGEPNPVYRRDTAREVSYFRDLFDAPRGERGALERLTRSQERAVSTGAGTGGEFAPPAWIIEDFVEFARADRVVADVIGTEPLEDGMSSINLPKIATGAGVAVQQTQNTTITDTGFTTTSVSSGIATITGKQKVSIQELRQTGIAIDRVILGDLAGAYAAMLDAQVISGSGANGQLRGLITAGTTVTFTTTQPAVVSTTIANSFYSKALGALSGMATDRKRPGTHWFLSPRRWYWILSALDSSNRPLVAASGVGMNQAAVTEGEPVAEGYGGIFLGLPAYIDGNIPTDGGVATNQDVAVLIRKPDMRLYESPVEQATFDATYADENAVLFRVLGFSAFIPDRHQASVQVISGTGLVAPTF